MIKKLIGAFLVAGVLVGAVYGAAASVGVTSAQIGAGDQTVDTCASAVDVSYTTNFTNGEYQLDTVTVTVTTGTCPDGTPVEITLTGTDSISNNPYTGSISTNAETFDVSAGTHDVADLDDVHVLVEG